jgi:hypothetical protein
MQDLVTGGCLCGAVRYAVDGAVGAAGYCHCADCRRTSGSAFGVSVRVDAARFRILHGSPKGFSKTGDSGRMVTRYFCPECGSPLYTVPPAHLGIYFIKGGSLDDPSVVRPDRQSWVRSRVTWAAIAPDLASFDRSRA